MIQQLKKVEFLGRKVHLFILYEYPAAVKINLSYLRKQSPFDVSCAGRFHLHSPNNSFNTRFNL